MQIAETPCLETHCRRHTTTPPTTTHAHLTMPSLLPKPSTSRLEKALDADPNLPTISNPELDRRLTANSTRASCPGCLEYGYSASSTAVTLATRASPASQRSSTSLQGRPLTWPCSSSTSPTSSSTCPRTCSSSGCAPVCICPRSSRCGESCVCAWAS